MHLPIEYYDEQFGGGCFGTYEKHMRGGALPNVYVGSSGQRGHGVGSFLGGLLRRSLPMIMKGLKAVGRESVHTGLNVLGDVAGGRPLKYSLKNRVKEAGGALKRKAEEEWDQMMSGEGYKRRRKRRKTHSTRKRKGKKTTTAARLKKKVTRKRKVAKRRTKRKAPAKKRRVSAKKSKVARVKKVNNVRARAVADIFAEKFLSYIIIVTSA